MKQFTCIQPSLVLSIITIYYDCQMCDAGAESFFGLRLGPISNAKKRGILPINASMRVKLEQEISRVASNRVLSGGFANNDSK